MPRTYQPRPCRRCGGEKGPRDPLRFGARFYCMPCADAIRDEWRTHGHICGTPEPAGDRWNCLACERAKGQRAVETRRRSQSGYFRPFDAERWWQQRCHAAVHSAVKKGLLPNLKSGEYACTDCGGVAHEYDHRDYGRPFDVEPVCRSCNKQRGTAVWPGPGRFNFQRIERATNGVVTRQELRPDIWPSDDKQTEAK